MHRLACRQSAGLVPQWLLASVEKTDPGFVTEPLTLFELEVVAPGLIRVRGFFVDGDQALVAGDLLVGGHNRTGGGMLFSGPPLRGGRAMVIFSQQVPSSDTLFTFMRSQPP